MLRIKLHPLFLLCLILPSLFGCTTSSHPPDNLSFDTGEWQQAGLDRVAINSFSSLRGSLYAATEHGLYITSGDNDTTWNTLDLRQDTVRKVVFLPGKKLLAAVRISDCCFGIPSLFLSTNQGENWEPYMNDFGGPTGKYTWVASITTPSQPSDTLFTQASGGAIARSIDGGSHWKMVNYTWDAFSGDGNFIFVDPYSKKNIWAGGSNAVFRPELYHSKDGGTTWQRIPVSPAGESSVYDLLLKQGNSDHILINIGYGLLKSTDGGENWHTAWNIKNFGVNTLTHSARDPGIVYASGQNADGTLFFAASRDFGDHWQTVTMASRPNGIYVNDIVSVMQNGHEVLYLGTNNGVYSYTFER